MFRAPHHCSHWLSGPTLLAACMAISVHAHADSIQLQLPAQSLASSLSDVAQRANIQLLFDEALLRNVKAPALNGTYTPQAAIDALLKDRFSIRLDGKYTTSPSDWRTNGQRVDVQGLFQIGRHHQDHVTLLDRQLPVMAVIQAAQQGST